MDLKCRQLISQIHSKIASHSFDEIDICTLLILIRENVLTNRDYQTTEWEYGFLREVGDFIAHRERDKGFVIEEAKLIYKHSFNYDEIENEEICEGKGYFRNIQTKRKVISGMFEDVIINELNTLFSRLSLTPIPKSSESEIILCIISLLQLTTFKVGDKKAPGWLYACIEVDGIHLASRVYGAGLIQMVLSVDDKNYCNLVQELIYLENDCFRLLRNGNTLEVILPPGNEQVRYCVLVIFAGMCRNSLNVETCERFFSIFSFLKAKMEDKISASIMYINNKNPECVRDFYFFTITSPLKPHSKFLGSYEVIVTQAGFELGNSPCA